MIFAREQGVGGRRDKVKAHSLCMEVEEKETIWREEDRKGIGNRLMECIDGIGRERCIDGRERDTHYE